MCNLIAESDKYQGKSYFMGTTEFTTNKVIEIADYSVFQLFSFNFGCLKDKGQTMINGLVHTSTLEVISNFYLYQ